jgi:hypothetical protein
LALRSSVDGITGQYRPEISEAPSRPHKLS